MAKGDQSKKPSNQEFLQAISQIQRRTRALFGFLGELGAGLLEPRLGPLIPTSFLPTGEAGLHRAVRSTTEALDEVPPPTLEDIAKREDGRSARGKRERRCFFVSFGSRKFGSGSKFGSNHPWSSFGTVPLWPAELVQCWSSFGPTLAQCWSKGGFQLHHLGLPIH